MGRYSQVSPNQFQRQFHQEAADQIWVTDIICIRTYESWLYLGVVLDLHSRDDVGWSMRGCMETTLVLDALRRLCGDDEPRALWSSTRLKDRILAVMSSVAGARITL